MEEKEPAVEEKTNEKPKVRQVVEAVDSLSLGISMVVAVAMGVGIGLVLKSFTGVFWTLWIGVFIGIAAAILNVYKAYEKQKEGYEELAKEPRYAIKKQLEDEDDEDYGDKSY
ncbi:AtpZ/AtpI family protein [Sulfurimonas lithotrophica]|uniref:AtpZ/AtpI family protein n=1 Tax=Sulfurimonas lithotrophica TaxID=2590022 RepID=A0A5P8P0Z1_9BACT|nr:AtpZ/AtpI family protein [Sulfurimonas lithotrophica]QFR49247.1 AtpZ/AtpI family protein [Sulfurimonas lithotrophica]